MLELNGVKNIIFDLGGVILNIDYGQTANAFKKIGVTNFDEIYSQAKQGQVFDKLETGKLSIEEFSNYMKEFVPSLKSIDIDKAWNAMLLDLPVQRIDLLKELKKGYRLFLLSNTNEIHIKAFRKMIKSSYGEYILDDIFEQQYYSSEIGMRKPNVDCFQYVLDQNGLEPSETLFIDDSMQHVEGARKLKIKAYHLKQEEDITTLFLDKAQ
jgi:HAD superfamily hydrolase (TIGR01549 family)|tara:strand:+ start:157 stop:789 length:633 start_codon:yes stop_codon:yes gene_type:complete